MSEQLKISDSDIVALFHNSSLEQGKAFQMMHNSFIKVLQELEKLKQVNYQLSEKLKLLEEIKEEEKWLSVPFIEWFSGTQTNQTPGGVSILSDILFLAKKEFDNKLLTETSLEFSTTGVKITRIPADLKIYYLYKAKVVLVGGDDDTYSGEILVHYQIKFDWIVVDNFTIAGFMEENAGEGPCWGMSGVMPKTTVIWKSFDGNGVKKVEVECIAITGTNVSAHVTLSGWEETTGEDPTI